MKKVIGGFSIAIIASLCTLGLNSFIEIHNSQQNVSNTIKKQHEPIAQFANYSSKPETNIDFTNAAEITINTVVHVKTTQEGQTYNYTDPFYDFLWGQGKKQQQYKSPNKHGSGSGVIISADGYIITNNHVVKGADNIEVTLNDKRTYTAKIVGIDASTDLSLLKINDNDLPYVSFGNSNNLKVGEWVLAVGNPYNLTSTVTAGIVSAKGRNIDILRDKFKIESFIQTDAAVNPGNSGGALVNTSGELVGINSAIASPTGSYSGYSFAIPINIVKKVVFDLKEFGTVQRAFIGISIQNIDAEFAKSKGLAELHGVYVTGIAEGGAADDAGIKEGDIITNVNGISVNNVPSLQEQINNFRPGDKVALQLSSSGNKKEIMVTLKNKDGNTRIVNKELKLHGATFKEVPNSLKNKLGIKSGIQIIELEKGKLKDAGIENNFIISKIDKQNINGIEDINLALSNKKGGVLFEGVYPDGKKSYYGFGI